MSDQNKYASTWEKLRVRSLGGKWAYGVGIIKDSNGTKKVRIVKGKLTHPFPKGPEWKEIDLTADANPISQVQKMNFKRPEEFTQLSATVKDLFEELNGGTE